MKTILGKFFSLLLRKPFSIKSSYLVESYLRYIGKSDDFIQDFHQKSFEQKKEYLRIFFYRKLSTFSRSLFRDNAFAEKSHFEKYLSMELSLSMEKMVSLLLTFENIEWLKQNIPIDLQSEILFYHFTTYLTYKNLFSHPTILLKNIPSHPTSQQNFFETLSTFIKQYAKQYRYDINNHRFDKRNKDSVLWANLISNLINPATRKKFDFNSEFRKGREWKGENEDNQELLSPLNISYHIDQLFLEYRDSKTLMNHLENLINERIGYNIYKDYQSKNKLGIISSVDPHYLVVLENLLHSEFFKQYVETLEEEHKKITSFETSLEVFIQYTNRVYYYKNMKDHPFIKRGILKARFIEYLAQK